MTDFAIKNCPVTSTPTRLTFRDMAAQKTADTNEAEIWAGEFGGLGSGM